MNLCVLNCVDFMMPVRINCINYFAVSVISHNNIKLGRLGNGRLLTAYDFNMDSRDSLEEILITSHVI